jgi:hypothetical protein
MSTAHFLLLSSISLHDYITIGYITFTLQRASTITCLLLMIIILAALCPVIKVKGKLQLPNMVRTTNNPHSSALKVWITPQGKEP